MIASACATEPFTFPQRKLPKLIAVVAFDRDEDGDLQPVFGPAEQRTEERAARAARAARPIPHWVNTASRRRCFRLATRLTWSENMSRADFIRKLEHAADKIGDMPRIDLQISLRRAALRLRNMPPAPRIASISNDLARIWRVILEQGQFPARQFYRGRSPAAFTCHLFETCLPHTSEILHKGFSTIKNFAFNRQ